MKCLRGHRQLRSLGIISRLHYVLEREPQRELEKRPLTQIQIKVLLSHDGYVTAPDALTMEISTQRLHSNKNMFHE